MKKTVTYAFERDDARQLSANFVMETFGALEGYVLSGETDKDDPCPGYRALRKMRGNMFTEDDVEAFVAWMKELGERAAARIAWLRAERNSQPRDERSLRAYDALIEMMENGRAMAARNVEDFLERFREADAVASMKETPSM